MIHYVVSISRFTILLLFAFYTLDCFLALRMNIAPWKQTYYFVKQTVEMFLILINVTYVLYLQTEDRQVIFIAAIETVFFLLIFMIYGTIYENASKSLLNNMCMLMMLGFLLLTRLDISAAFRQLIIAIFAFAITCFIPYVIEHVKVVRNFSYAYAALGLLGLFLVLVFGRVSYGAKLSLHFGPLSLQPSEFVKLLFVIFVAAMYTKSKSLKQIIITTGIAMLHVLLLVASKDLGSAMIFTFTYLILIYVCTKKLYWLFLGLGTTAIGAMLAYRIFAHVQVRVTAWQDPLSVVDDAGYQICQSLFAIGTGGWYGSGIGNGMPNTIPVVTKDFIFSAMCEEYGVLFGLCFIFVCISCFLMIFNIALELDDTFYRYVAIGLGTVYGFQVFVNIGGVTKFIPSTGVTLPFVSYGGSSLLSTMAMFSIVQGLYVVKQRQEAHHNER
ncbi:MAG: FtsW/RodA/SpoVE family cell cycle protein [Lachnospiraceae bacterium]|nr:FtsW/RodA/SpoVE family cell cycle protein [Lachnospiraceae bacterium]